MTTVNERRREVGTVDAGTQEQDAEPWPFATSTEFLVQRDDDEFAPTIVRGRE
jgi:hypothetical protein